MGPQKLPTLKDAPSAWSTTVNPRSPTKKTLKTVGTILACLALVALAQAKDYRKVRTEVVDNQHTLRWQRDAAGSDYRLLNGWFFKSLTVNGLVVSAALDDTGSKMRAETLVVNDGQQRVDIVPSMMTLDIVDPKPKSLAYQDPSDMEKSIRHRAAIAQIFNAMSGLGQSLSMSTSSTMGAVNVTDNNGNFASGTYSGETTTTTSSPDPVARQVAAERGKEIAQNAARSISDLEGMVLLSNTLTPQQGILGTVFFARTFPHDTTVLRVPVHLRNLSGAELGNLVFEFPFRWNSKKSHGMIIRQAELPW
jgi:hypothetical protein